MAKSALDEAIKGIKRRLEKDSQTYRSLVSDKKVHSITVSEQKLKTQIKKEMLSRGGYREGQLPQSIIDIIDTEVPKMCKGMYEDFRNFNTDTKQTEVKDLRGNSKRFTFILSAKPGKTANIFNQFRLIKQENQRDLIKKLKAQIKKLNKSRSENNKIRNITRNFLDIGHQEGSAVSEQRKQEVEKALFDWSSDNNNPIVKQFLKELQSITNFKITKNSSKGSADTVKVELESKFLNRQRGGSIEKAAGIQLTQDIQDIIEKMDAFDWVNQEGSDSKFTKIKKTVKNPFAKVSKKNKKIKTNFSEEKITYGKSRGSTKSKTTKATASKYKDRTPVAIEGFDSNDRQSLFQLAVLINQKLPQTVANNMGDPRLNYRSGRFASSVKVTEVMATKKGYPSIGYTYQKNPYQTFERGYAKGSDDRDPRKLIDASIREIAAEMAIGRFFTRRV